ncbi:monovalent cation/H+ antiporter complex subunit F [Jannaschia sp. R86511]|uniref:monovalent cation/H+ antiporter complex subunit F n=1 Tax=Jannaschia sp. R86511 TaxID=3093853 RepID=UPI0036D3BFCC
MIVVDIALGVLALALLPALWRIAVGPTDADRALSADHVFFVFLAVAGLLAVRLQDSVFLDVVLVGTLVGFLATVTLARLVDRGRS